jgi:hypothetical protein
LFGFDLYPLICHAGGKKDLEEKIMSEDRIFFGLCLTCQNAGECTFPRDPARPIWQCEEFMGNGRAPERVSVEGCSPLKTGLIEAEKELGTWIGLCKNCANRQACRYPKPEGGIWRCEEYL